MPELENRFELAMYEIYRRAKEECGYDAKRFLIMLKSKGGVATAKELLHNDKSYEGLIHLIMCNCKHLTVEAHVLLPEYSELFTEEEKRIAKSRIQ
ncbi:hypothetical protein [Geomobilimonas luticola]|uniref:Uncharacterized protein n=1 Tax=Geomobilimonas luticola TaxID=1114878 RepID=A0ABS5S850_9BACT|nr:hypothetical protein [Geomobilimonas luticola]MBT0651544.1 hypothetical protein [Geomobilimonas luticola]